MLLKTAVALLLAYAAPPAAAALRASGLALWPAGTNVEDHQGLIATPDSAPRATVIVFHGNAGSAVQRRYYRDALTPLGYRVLLAQYPGYGGRLGSPLSSSRLCRTVRADSHLDWLACL